MSKLNTLMAGVAFAGAVAASQPASAQQYQGPPPEDNYSADAAYGAPQRYTPPPRPQSLDEARRAYPYDTPRYEAPRPVYRDQRSFGDGVNMSLQQSYDRGFPLYDRFNACGYSTGHGSGRENAARQNACNALKSGNPEYTAGRLLGRDLDRERRALSYDLFRGLGIRHH